jgi:hemoglobin
MEQAPLFDRLGGRTAVTAVVEKAIANHFDNSTVSTRFEHASQSVGVLIDHAVEFFCTGLTGVATYTGRPLAQAHAGMNVSEQEFIAVLDDIVEAMVSVGIGDLERSEVLAMLYGMKDDVIRL